MDISKEQVIGMLKREIPKIQDLTYFNLEDDYYVELHKVIPGVILFVNLENGFINFSVGGANYIFEKEYYLEKEDYKFIIDLFSKQYNLLKNEIIKDVEVYFRSL